MPIVFCVRLSSFLFELRTELFHLKWLLKMFLCEFARAAPGKHEKLHAMLHPRELFELS